MWETERLEVGPTMKTMREKEKITGGSIDKKYFNHNCHCLLNISDILLFAF